MKQNELLDIFELVFDMSHRLVALDLTPHDLGRGQTATRAELHLVSALAQNSDRSVTELAKDRGVTKGAVSQLLARLEKKGLIEKRVDEANASRLLVRLTNEGQLVHQGHQELHDMVCQAFVEEVGDLDDETLALIREFLLRCDHLVERLTVKG